MKKSIDYTGQVFNDLTALKCVGSILLGDSRKKSTGWKFKCICGNEPILPLYQVLSGHTLSCGCRRSRDNNNIKLCSDCGEQSFRLNRHGNPCSLCHDCHNKRVSEHHKKTDDPLTKLVNSARARAKRDGLPFDLTPDDISIPSICPILGIPIIASTGTVCENSPTLDKVIPEKGYVAGNCVVVSWRANTIKSCGTVEEHYRVAVWMQQMIEFPPAVSKNRRPALEFQSPEHRRNIISEAQKKRRKREREERESQLAGAAA